MGGGGGTPGRAKTGFAPLALIFCGLGDARGKNGVGWPPAGEKWELVLMDKEGRPARCGGRGGGWELLLEVLVGESCAINVGVPGGGMLDILGMECDTWGVCEVGAFFTKTL